MQKKLSNIHFDQSITNTVNQAMYTLNKCINNNNDNNYNVNNNDNTNDNDSNDNNEKQLYIYICRYIFRPGHVRKLPVNWS